MFGKLVKYEFKSVGKWYLWLYAALFALSVLAGLMTQSFISGSWSGQNDVISPLILSAFFFMMFGLAIATILLVANRFKDSIFSRQGYLTMTLPVSEHQIILSKMIVGLFWSILASVALLLALMLFGIVVGSNYNLVSDMFSFITRFITEYPLEFLRTLLYLLVMGIFTIAILYWSISLAQLATNGRDGLAVVYYFVNNFLIQLFHDLIFGTNYSVSLMSSAYNYGETTYGAHFWLTIVFYLIMAVLAYLGTYWFIKHKLNLD